MLHICSILKVNLSDLYLRYILKFFLIELKMNPHKFEIGLQGREQGCCDFIVLIGMT